MIFAKDWIPYFTNNVKWQNIILIYSKKLFNTEENISSILGILIKKKGHLS